MPNTRVRPLTTRSRSHDRAAARRSTAAVRGPKYVVTTGKTPVLDGAEWRKIIDAIPTDTVRELRDRALIATLTYSFARIGAALKLKVEDLRPNGTGWQIFRQSQGRRSCGRGETYLHPYLLTPDHPIKDKRSIVHIVEPTTPV